MPNIKPNRYTKKKRYYIGKFEKNPFELVSNICVKNIMSCIEILT